MKMKFYTWKDIDRYFSLNHTLWEDTISSVDIYPTDVTVYVKKGFEGKALETIQNLFGNNYNSEKEEINLDIGNCTLPINLEEDEGIPNKGSIQNSV